MSQPVHPKVKASAAGGGIAGALTVIMVYIASLLGVDLPPEVASAITTLLTVFVGFAAGYQKTS